MIGYLRGEVLDSADGRILLGISSGPVGMTLGMPSEGAGATSANTRRGCMVGYSVAVPQSARYGLFLVGEVIELFIYSHIREDAFDLYGFSTPTEKELFLVLLSVNGVGPKSSLGIISSTEPDALIEAIVSGDQSFLTRIPGIGKKTAERMVVELRDSIRKKVDAGGFTFSASSAKQTEGPAKNRAADSSILKDAKLALVSLGYRETEVYPLLQRVLDESQPRFQRAEDLIKSALRQLA